MPKFINPRGKVVDIADTSVLPDSQLKLLKPYDGTVPEVLTTDAPPVKLTKEEKAAAEKAAKDLLD